MQSKAILSDGILTISNALVRRVWLWRGGDIATLSLSAPDEPMPPVAPEIIAGAEADAFIPGVSDSAPAEARFTAEEMPETAAAPAHLRATVETRRANGSALRLVFRVFDSAPALELTVFVESAAPVSAPAPEAAGSTGAVENARALSRPAPAGRAATLDSFPFPGPHWRARAVEFFDVTDRNDNLAAAREIFPYSAAAALRGNVLTLARIGRAAEAGRGFFIIKQTALGAAQHGWAGHDFSVKTGRVETLGGAGCGGAGWMRAGSCAAGVFTGDARIAARRFQKCLRRHIHARDDMVMLNTWGDRSRDGRLCEAFAIAEIERAAELGATHFQLDDGWQKGLSHNSAFAGGEFPDIARRGDYWTAHPERFPRGLGPVAECARRCGVALCLWFNPSSADGYAAWRKDADAMLSLHAQHGISVFKIDGLQVESAAAEANVRAMFDAVVDGSRGAALFNLDATAGRRFGYFHFTEYGNIFLENRYTDWANHHPHRTLRNLWTLASFVPPEKLQIEFLNKWRNAANYGADDPLAPSRVPFDWALAATLAAQPLAWFEASGLPREGAALAEINAAAALLEKFAPVSGPFHEGVILPVGMEPDGFCASGFISICEGGGGWLIALKGCDKGAAPLLLEWPAPHGGGGLRALLPLAGAAAGAAVEIRGAHIAVSLPGAWSYGVWRVDAK